MTDQIDLAAIRAKVAAGRVEIHDAGIWIREADGLSDPVGSFYEAAKGAVWEAAGAVGAAAVCPSDGDVYLDWAGGEDRPDGLSKDCALDVAVGIIARGLAAAGFPVIVVDVLDCPTCGQSWDPPPCPVCGGHRTIDSRLKPGDEQ